MNNYELKNFNEAIYKIKKKKIKDSEKILSKINNHIAYYNAALIAENEKNIDLALKFYDKSIRLNTN